MKFRTKYCWVLFCFLVLVGCSKPTNVNDETKKSETSTVEQESEKQTSVRETQIVLQREVNGLEEGLRIWYLSCENGGNPIEGYIKNEWDGYGGGTSRHGKMVIQEYTMYTLKEYLIGFRDEAAEGIRFKIDAQMEEYGKVLLKIMREKVDDPEEEVKEVNLLIQAERPINDITIFLDGEEIHYIEAPFFGMVYS